MPSIRPWTILFFCLGPFASGVAPALAKSPRTVEIGLFLIDVSSIDERAETYTGEFDVITRSRDGRSVARILEDSPLPDGQVAHAICALLERGILSATE